MMIMSASFYTRHIFFFFVEVLNEVNTFQMKNRIFVCMFHYCEFPSCSVQQSLTFLSVFRDEDAPAQIPDEDAAKPEGWLDDEPEYIGDPDAVKPEDW